jgi:tetratricopeptide (TPR) repeat protein
MLSQALDLSEAERDDFLADAIRKEPALRTEVLALFEEMRRTSGFLDPPPDMPEPVSIDGEASLGSYRVIGELGKGGMGVVHLAERSDGQFTRRVAIKRVHSAAPGADVLRRFRHEREILARLDHPNIARLLDAGLDSGGIPYLVMEHVEGVPVTLHCRRHALSVPQRLTLFVKVCAAVQHAHQNLVIHRDIKPGNILVTDAGEPKLLDFGIAKILDDAVAGDATQTVNRALTLDYASPEQVRGSPVTTASDVYSLGVVLYEILADRRPHEVATESLSEAVRLVCESTPPPPSKAAPQERRSELAGDLDSMVGKAMEKAAADRYASAAELADDVAAHLQHLPVKARRPAFGYVARKFVRRHRAGAAVAATLLLLLLGGVAAVLRQARVARAERVRAQRRFEQVRELAHYVIYDLQDGISKLAGSTELRKAMVERSLTYLDSLAGEAEGDPGLQKELAGAYARLGEVLGRPMAANLGDPDGARASYAKARALLDDVITRNPTDTDARRDLGRLLLHLAGTYVTEQQAQAAGPLADSMAIWEKLVQEDATNEQNLRGLASAHFSASAQKDQMRPHMERALQLFEALLAMKPDDPNRKRNVALCHKTLAANRLPDPDRSYAHAQEAVRLDLERVTGDPHDAQARLDYSVDVSILGDLHIERREYAEALEQFELALARRRELWTADAANVYARERLAHSLMRVAYANILLDRHPKAAPLLGECLAHIEALHSRNPDVRLNVLVTESLVYLFLGEVAQASGGDPCRRYRQMAELLPKLEERRYEPEAATRRDRALGRLKTCSAETRAVK